MDGHGFDRFARLLAAGASRRTVLRGLGAGGLGAALAGRGRWQGVAAQGTPEAEELPAGPATVQIDGLCAMIFELAVRQGPSAGLIGRGILSVAVDPEGRVDGTFLLGSGRQAAVTGQATGRAISLIVDLGDGLVIYGVGAADNNIASCQIEHMGGPLVGPQPGDSGDWLLIRDRRDLIQLPEGTFCVLGDPDCPPGLELPEGSEPPTGGGGNNPSGPGPRNCDDLAGFDSCTDVCQASNRSSDCDSFCAETLFCAA
jgi:hypothetical protein